MKENRSHLTVLESCFELPSTESSYMLNLKPDHGQEIFRILRKAIKKVELEKATPGSIDTTFETRRHLLELQKLSSKFAPLSPEEEDPEASYIQIVFLTRSDYELIQKEGRKRFGGDSVENNELESTLEELQEEFSNAERIAKTIIFDQEAK